MTRYGDSGVSSEVLVGEEVLRYDPGNYLLFTVDLPVVFRVEEASNEMPYFGLRLNLDSAIVTSVMMETGAETRKGDACIKAIGVNAVDADLLDAIVGNVELADQAVHGRSVRRWIGRFPDVGAKARPDNRQ